MQGQPIKRRASMHAPTRMHAQATRTTRAHPRTVDDISDDERLYQPANHGTSVMRSRTTEGYPVEQQGKRRFVMLDGSPPTRTSAPPKARRHHWLAVFGTGMLVMVLIFMAINEIGSTWQAHQLDAQYGMPRTYQVDAVVGHNGDSAAHPSHFTFVNLHATIIITEFPAGDAAKAIVYTGPPLIGDNAESIPVTGFFQDRNGDGKPDMIVQVINQQFVYLNTGSKFVSGPLP